MSEKERLAMFYADHPWGEQSASGVDLDAIRYNLRLTIEERIEKHRRALESILALTNAVKPDKYRTSH